VSAIPGHRLELVGMPGSKSWKCSCGGWARDVPAIGPYGRTSYKARIAQLNMAHGKHARAADAATRKAENVR
jgi:hypothetical protein